MSSFGQKFKQERLKKGLTQQEIAEIFFLNKSSISRYEQDKQVPELDTLKMIADFFGCTTDYLTGRDKNLVNEINKKNLVTQRLIEEFEKNNINVEDIDLNTLKKVLEMYNIMKK